LQTHIITLIFTRTKYKVRGHAKDNARGRGRGQFSEAESEDKTLASRPACPQGHHSVPGPTRLQTKQIKMATN